MKIRKKNIHCKDGLDRQQELMARKIRRILLDENNSDEKKDIILSAIKKFNMQYGKDDKYEPFDSFIKREDPILHSAIKRTKFNVLEYLSENNFVS